MSAKKLINTIKSVEPSFINLFEEQVNSHPDDSALYYEGESLSYLQLNSRANYLARVIQHTYLERVGCKISADTCIGLSLDRGLDSIVSILAILKTGAAYVPIDPSLPQERINYILKDAEIKVMVSEKSLKHKIITDKQYCKGIIYADDYTNPSLEDSQNLNVQISEKSLAYAIYTSGSTGQPKGVMIEHRSMSNVIRTHSGLFFKHQARVLQFLSISFDASVTEILSSLASGSCLYIVPKDLQTDICNLPGYLSKHQINTVVLPASVLNVLPQLELPHLKKIIIGGEVGSQKVIDYWAKGRKFFNTYGPTECTICASYCELGKGFDAKCIGKPMPNTSFYIVDEAGKLQAKGHPGELYISGIGVARGYLNQPGLNQEKFIKNQFENNADNGMLYKTGDMVRLLDNGNLEYLGRVDSQVKVRGYRIELGEIESAMLTISHINEVCVISTSCQDNDELSSNNNQIVAYYTTTQLIDDKTIVRQLKCLLPSYMVPNSFIELDSLPLTINGKIDKKALPKVALTLARSSYVAPNNELEKKVCEIWMSVLNMTNIGVADDFFCMGGNSILAAKLTYQMSKLLKVNLSVKVIFRNRTIRKILDAVGSINNSVMPIPKAVTKAPLSFFQEAMCFFDKYAHETEIYQLPIVLKLSVDIDDKLFYKALEEVVKRHDILQTIIGSYDDGTNYQVLKPGSLDVCFKEFQCEESFHTALERDMAKSFNLQTAWPIKIINYKVGNKSKSCDNYILINIHHIAFDGWSISIFMNELIKIYQALKNSYRYDLPKLSLRYADYATWQKSALVGEGIGIKLDYWKNQLSGFEQFVLPLGKRRPHKQQYVAKNIQFKLSKVLSSKLIELAKEHGVTLYTVLLSGFYLFLYKLSGRDDLVVGAPMANRDDIRLHPLVGNFANATALRAKLQPAMLGKEFISSVSQMLAEAQENQAVPFDMVVSHLGIERSQSYQPIFQIMFGMDDFSLSQEQYHHFFDVVKTPRDYPVSRYDLEVFSELKDGIITGRFNYAVSILDNETVCQYIQYYIEILKQITSSVDCSIQSYTLINKSEQAQIINESLRDVQRYPVNTTLHQMFEKQATQTPDHIALKDANSTLTYAELNSRSNQLARYIKNQYYQHYGDSIKPGEFITICLEPGVEMIVSILAVLKLGAAYVPVSTASPTERIAHIIKDTNSKLLIATNNNLTIEVPALNISPASYSSEDNTNLNYQVDADHNAYVIYTSGSTGKPKGVVQSHKNVLRLFDATKDLYHFNASDVWTLYHSYAFDFSVWEIWGALLHGAKLLIPSRELVKNIPDFCLYCEKNKVTILNQTPMAFHQLSLFLVNNKHIVLDSLRQVIFGGDVLGSQSLKNWWIYAKHNTLSTRLVNMYGITEITVHATYKVLEETNLEPSNIGKPLNDMAAFVLDDSLNVLPKGMIGELYITGAGISPGYLNRQALTKSRFINSPFHNGILYKTGDLVRWLPNNELEYIARNDNQVKIRGHRIELGEIEEVLIGYSSIKQVRVFTDSLTSDNESTKILIAYYVSDMSINAEVLIEYLSRHLPEYMIPLHYIHLEKFPLTINGKLDRKKLPQLTIKSIAQEYLAPRSELETRLCCIWRKLLGNDLIGVMDDFFKIGGNSILALQLAHQISKELNVSLNVTSIFKYKTIEKLAQSQAFDTYGNKSNAIELEF